MYGCELISCWLCAGLLVLNSGKNLIRISGSACHLKQIFSLYSPVCIYYENDIFFRNNKQVGVVAALYTCIQNVPSSDVGWILGCLDWCSSWSLQVKAEIVGNTRF
jgi:hypothetical protein